MKKLLLFNFLSLILLIGLCFSANAQREVVIEGYPITGGGDINKYADAITKALAADAANRAKDPNVVYILNRNQLYPNATTIKNTFVLRMKASSGSGALPAIIQWANSQGKYSRHLEAQEDVYFENIQFENQAADGSIQVRSQRLVANGIRGVFKGCVFYQDGGGAITAWADSIKIFVYDCFAHSIGRVGENNSNGRFVDARMPTYCDSVIIQNCTADHLNGAFFRGGSAITGYLKIDHCTMINGRTGEANMFRPKELIFTNNLFVNSRTLGEFPTRDPLDTNPDHAHDVVIDVDTIWNISKVTVRNNNVYTTKDVKDMWAKYDTITEPLKVDPLIQRMLGADSVNTAFEEVLTFKNLCSTPLAYYEAIYKTPSATQFPNQLCLGTNPGGLFPDQVDASYNTNSKSYTAAAGGFPVGDLNWFPEKKALWLQNPSVAVKALNEDQIEVYPNPATDKLFINTGDLSNVNVILYNILGKEVNNTIYNGGNIEVDLSSLKQGMYIYRISDSGKNTIKAGKLLISR